VLFEQEGEKEILHAVAVETKVGEKVSGYIKLILGEHIERYLRTESGERKKVKEV